MHPDTLDSEPFRRGYERGRAYEETRLHFRVRGWDALPASEELAGGA